MSFKHAMRRLAAAHPAALDGCPWAEQGVQGARGMLDLTVRVHSTGHRIPAAIAAAQRVYFDLDKAAADCFAAHSGQVQQKEGGGEGERSASALAQAGQ